METQFDLVLSLIPIALLIALRIYASRKKKGEEAERAKVASLLARAASAKAAPAAALPPDGLSGRTASEALDFDAHALVPDDDDDFSGAPARFYARAKPVAEGEPPRVRHAASGVLSDSLAGPRAQSPESRSIEDVEHAVGEADRPEGAAALPILARLDRLGPLKRAVVMAEILGRPKGI